MSPPHGGGVNICMLVKNSFEYDARVEREATTLAQADHTVTVVALLVDGVTPASEGHRGGFAVVRVSQPQFGVGRIVRWLERSGGDRVGPPSTATPGHDRRAEPAREPVPGLRRTAVRALAAIVRVVRAAVAMPARALKDWILDRRMARVAIESGADVVHAHDLNTLRAAVGCRRATGARIVYDSHELAADRSRMTAWGRFRARRLEGRLIGHAEALIVASPPWEQILVERYHDTPDVRASIVNAPLYREVDPIDLHALASVEPGTPIILYQGSIQEHRGIEHAIEAMQSLDDMALVVIGYGHHRPALEAMVERLELGRRVRFTGPIPHAELLAHTAGATIGLCTIVSSSLSYHTSLPNKLFEYLMAGIPVIGSEGPEIARVITDTGAGVVVPATDPSAIAAAARQIVDDHPRYAAAAVTARRTRHWGTEAEKLLELYGHLSEANGP